MKELKLPEGEHFISLTLDLTFKMVFGDSRNIDILKSLLGTSKWNKW